MVAVLRGLVDYYVANPDKVPARLGEARVGTPVAGSAARDSEEAGAIQRAITYVSGMTDRFAFSTAVRLLGWPVDRLPRGVDAPASTL